MTMTTTATDVATAAPNRSLMTEDSLDDVRARLERQRQTLLRRAAEFVDDIEDLQTPTATLGQGETELATRQVDVELRKALDASTRNTLEGVTRALARLGDGSYGICTDCHQPIERDRLLALPQVDLCVSCQTQREQGA
jgi:DnaK suppressor protein